LQRREQGVAVAFESQRARLVQSIDAGLAQTAAEGSTDEPLQLDSSRRTHAQEVTQASMGLICPHARSLQLGRRQDAPVPHRQSSSEGAQPLTRMLPSGL